MKRKEFHASVSVLLACCAPAAGQDWTTFAGDAARRSHYGNRPPSLSPLRWVASTDANGQPIAFDGQSGAVTLGTRVYALGRSSGQSRLYCFDALNGQCFWGSPIPQPVLESWTTPSIDIFTGTIFVASGRYLTAFNAAGAQLWQTELMRNVAGASPAISTDAGPADRAFITDYDGFGSEGRLYCINIDATAGNNPYQPGQILWSVVLGGTSANTPTYFGGRVYVASVTGPSGTGPGVIRAYNGGATSPPSPLWTFTNPEAHGFFGGVGVFQNRIMAASYSFSGGQLSANLVTVDRDTGTLRWSLPCNRTDAIPVAWPDGTLVLSSGIRGFGSIPSIQLIRDDGNAGTMIWDTAIDSWVDVNNNSVMDPGEYLDVGGWTVQPVLSMYPGPGIGPVIYAGRLPAGSSTASACTDIFELDVSRFPSDPLFVRAFFAGAGSSPALSRSGVYTLGPAGLHALGIAPCPANCDDSTSSPVLTPNDFQCFVNNFAIGHANANCDQSTGTPSLTGNDFLCFINQYAAGCPE